MTKEKLIERIFNHLGHITTTSNYLIEAEIGKFYDFYANAITQSQLTISAQSADLMDYEKRLCDIARLAQRVISIGEENGWFDWKGNAEDGGNYSSLHRDLLKVANQRVYKDFCDLHTRMIKELEDTHNELKQSHSLQSEIIVRLEHENLTLLERITELETPKSCDGCKYWNSCVMNDLHIDALDTYSADIKMMRVSCQKYVPRSVGDD